MKANLKVAFVGFAWGPFPDPLQYFQNVLSEDYDVTITESDFPPRTFDTGAIPDLVIRTLPGVGVLKHTGCPVVHFPAELHHPNMEQDWWMTHDFVDHPRHYRLPLYALYGDFHKFTGPKYTDYPWERKFCCVLFGKSYPREQTPREAFFHKLCEYKPVDSAGHVLNNVGFEIPGSQSGPDKIKFLRDYKFTLAFENNQSLGYTTEKITDPMFANSIPVFWGNPIIERDFNTKSFVNCHEYIDFDKVIEKIIELDTNPEAYTATLREPWFVGRKINEFIDKKNVLNFFHRVLNDAN